MQVVHELSGRLLGTTQISYRPDLHCNANLLLPACQELEADTFRKWKSCHREHPASGEEGLMLWKQSQMPIPPPCHHLKKLQACQMDNRLSSLLKSS